MSAAVQATAAANGADVSPVSATGADLGPAGRLAALIDPAFLAETRWDVISQMLRPPSDHPLLGRPVCRVPGCSTTATNSARICYSCQRELGQHGLAGNEADSLPERTRPPRGPGACIVAGCRREWVASSLGLCATHLRQQQGARVSLSEFCADPTLKPLCGLGPCQVVACERQRRNRDGHYCDVHQQRLRSARGRAPGLDESCWRLAEAPISRGGQISLRGLDPLVVAQVLVGLQQRSRLDGVKTKQADLRALCNDLRRQQVATLGDYAMDADVDGGFQALFNSLITHVRRALADPEIEVTKDKWDLAVFGQGGSLSFGGIHQRWLREVAKRWALDDLPRRRSATAKAGLVVRHHLGCLVRLSQSLRIRPDGGEIPAALGRGDIEAFLNRLAYQQSVGQISGDARLRTCREVRGVLTRARAMGLTRPGAPAAGLAEDFAIHFEDIPDEPEPGEAGRDLPPEIMRQLCAQLPDVRSPEMRIAIEIAIDTGRRPEELCSLAFDCLARDEDGLPVLVYDNHKANRLARRLPISESTAQLLVDQRQRTRERYPHTPVAELKLLPTDRRNPNGARAITAFSLSFHHRAWVSRMPVLRGADGVEFDKAKVVLYAYRHTYAQRHADAGVGIDVLRELMDHRKLDTTRRYYRVGENRRREAVDRVAALQFDRHGNRVWRSAQALLDSEHARRAVGEIAVPFGLCAEPSNVKAGGNACPFRFRCAGCDHFRTDVSYLPDLSAYLDDLLRNRERLLAADDIEEWARAEAMPSEEEITRIRRLIARVSAGLERLGPKERDQVDQAVSTVRRHRAVMLGMPRNRQSLPDLRPERSA